MRDNGHREVALQAGHEGRKSCHRAGSHRSEFPADVTQAGAIFFALVACSGCAVHKPQTYRLVGQGTAAVLLPPGVTAPDLAQRKVTADMGGAPCAPAAGVVAMRVRKSWAVITVKRDTLLKQPPGWLSDWTAELESQS